jgi:hypothetical protein
MLYVFLLSLLLLPLVWNTPARTATLFSLTFVIITWVQMAIIRGAGGGVHHTILLWPMPLIPPAAILAQVSRKGSRSLGFAIFLILVACAANLLVTSTYFSHLVRNGSDPTWTEALDDAHQSLVRMNAGAVSTYDWGFWDNLRLLSEGRLHLSYTSISDLPESRVSALERISNPEVVFIGYVDGSEAVPGTNQRLREFAASLGYEPADRLVFNDSNGREVIQTFRFRKIGSGATGFMSMQPQSVQTQDGSIVRNDNAIDRIVPSGAKIEKLADGFQFTEGPIYMPAGHLLFSDIPANTIFRWTHDGKVTEFRKPSGYDGNEAPAGAFVGSNGLTLDKEGRLIVCEHGNRRVTRLENDGRVTVLADRYEGKLLKSPNDAVHKSDGSLYFTDPPYGLIKQDSDPKKELPFNGIYRLSAGKPPAPAHDLLKGRRWSDAQRFHCSAR